eukprot:TRINITY_DN7729_c2_g1_i1.p1 TRINITY_DN7729_c2_g1~~TRINITY_DN7729_c2_g1_i1.p1  ORF type:complete len:454 (-),score=141.56 TRINITY_DN7729_c2_g1_i1:5-1198(-)
MASPARVVWPPNAPAVGMGHQQKQQQQQRPKKAWPPPAGDDEEYNKSELSASEVHALVDAARAEVDTSSQDDDDDDGEGAADYDPHHHHDNNLSHAAGGGGGGGGGNRQQKPRSVPSSSSSSTTSITDSRNEGFNQDIEGIHHLLSFVGQRASSSSSPSTKTLDPRPRLAATSSPSPYDASSSSSSSYRSTPRDGKADGERIDGDDDDTTKPHENALHFVEEQFYDPVDLGDVNDRAAALERLQNVLMTPNRRHGQQDEEDEQLLATGRWGEAFVYALLQAQYGGGGAGRPDGDHAHDYDVRWVNKDTESGASYDIHVRDKTAKGKDLFIEVKSTRSISKYNFEVSLPELVFACQKKDQFIIYRVFNAGSSSGVRVCKIVNPARWLSSHHLGLFMNM